MKLTEQELNSSTWHKLKEHWESRLNQLRISNDNDKNDIETAKLRGRIMELRFNLSLGTPEPEIDE